jgi:hypothetical protein
MQKYRLIKEYPGSPKVGTILEPNKFGNAVYEGIWLYKVNCSPEYWESIVEKDFEILSFISKKDCTIHHLVENTITYQANYPGCNRKDLFTMLYMDDVFKIYSVKRLSDGEVFTIGDDFINNFGSISKIDSIEIVGNTVDLQYYSRDKYGCKLSDVKKAKKPLFTTEDGVNIFKGDKYWFVYGELVKEAEAYSAIYHDLPNYYFSTKEAAEEYVIMNKPCLSLKEIYSLSSIELIQRSPLYKIVKSKI